MIRVALEGHDSRYGYHHQTFGIHLVVLTAHWAFNMRAHVLCYWVNIPQLSQSPIGFLAIRHLAPRTTLPLGASIAQGARGRG